MKWLLTDYADLYIVVVGLLVCVGCASSSVVYTESIDPMIKNGYVVDVAYLQFDSSWTLKVPAGTFIQRAEKSDKVIIKQRKELKVFEHPPEIASIRDARLKMGTLACREGNRIEIVSFGESRLSGVGGRYISLTCMVPPSIDVEIADQGSVPHKVDGLTHATMTGDVNTIDRDNEWMVLQNAK